MRLCIAILCGTILAGAVEAQTVEVRSGEHENFTRLIVDLPQRQPFEITYGVDSASIVFSNQTFAFDTAPVFARISRDRIQDVEVASDQKGLKIQLGCDCEVSTFWHGPSLLVMDVREAEVSVLLKDEPLSPGKESDQPPRKIDLDSLPDTTSLAASLVEFESSPISTLETDTTRSEDVPLTKKSEANDQKLQEARQRLAMQIGRAASQGLLSPRTSLRRNIDEPQPTEGVLEQEQPIDEEPNDTLSHVNLHAQSSMDRDFLALLGSNDGTTPAMSCLPDDMLDVGAWGTDAPFAEQIGTLHTNLTNEVDAVQHETAIGLIKLYLFYGFGAEANAMLDLVDLPMRDTHLYHSISEIMEHGYASSGSILSDQLSCDNFAALWSVLSYEELPRDIPVESDAALRAFDTLPRHLRSHLGPVLSRRLLEGGHDTAADNVLRILDRHEETITTQAQLVEAEINIHEGQPNEAMETLQEVVSSNSEPSPDALISLIDTSILTEGNVSYDQAMLAGAYAQQYKGDTKRKDLVRVYLIGLAASGAFEQAYQEFEALRSELQDDVQLNVRSELLNQLSRKSDEITFVQLVLGKYRSNLDLLNPSVANSAADRLYELGFYETARSFVAAETVGQANRKRKLLRAKISLAAGEPEQVETDLSGLESEEAIKLLADARSLSGDHATAAELYAQIDDEEKTIRELWLAEDWQNLMDVDNSALSDVAALVASSDQSPTESQSSVSDEDSNRVLARNRGLLQQSSATRETIGQILQASPSPADSTQ